MRGHRTLWRPCRAASLNSSPRAVPTSAGCPSVHSLGRICGVWPSVCPTLAPAARLPAMTDWGFDGAAWDEILRTTGRGIELLNKIADALARWRKATRPEDRRTVEKEVEELQADLQKLVDMLVEYFKHRREFMESIVRLLGPMDAPEGERNVDELRKWIKMVGNIATIIPDHERRILALERARRGGVE